MISLMRQSSALGQPLSTTADHAAYYGFFQRCQSASTSWSDGQPVGVWLSGK
jgi:hypothetical protein